MDKLNKNRIHTSTSGTLLLFFYDPDSILWMEERIPALLTRQDGIPVRSSQFATVMQFENPLTGEAFYYKEFHNRGLKDLLKNLVGLTRSKRAFTAGHQLLKFGFPTPEPVLHGVVRIFFFIRKNFMITRAVSGDRTYEYFKHRYNLPLPPELLEEKRALIYKAGHEIGRLHRAGIFHGDLRVGNLIIEGYGPASKIYFVDNERTMRYGILSADKRLKNLVQLNMVGLPHISNTDRLRFMNAYLKENPELEPTAREMIRKIIGKTKKRLQKKYPSVLERL
ncbi:MAG: lipopolysaccharide kinase InaA family protein [Thermodesulfovibrionales bacterium]